MSFPLAARVGTALLATGLLLASVSALQDRALRDRDPAALQSERAARLAAARDRFSTLSEEVRSFADRAAALPKVKEALRGDRAALIEVFRALEKLGPEDDRPAAAIHALPFAKVAWARPTADLRGLEGRLGPRRELHVLEGSVTTLLIATTPIEDGGKLLGVATAETALRVERHISNQFLRDFDRVEGPDGGLSLEYFGAQAAPAPAAPPGTLELRAPDGRVLAFVSAAPSPSDRASPRAAGWRRAGGLLVWAGLLTFVVGIARRPLGFALSIALLRLSVSVLGPPWPLPLPGPSPEGEGPLEAILDSLLALTVAWALCRLVLDHAPRRFRPLASALAALFCLPVLGVSFGFLGRVVADSPWDLSTISLLPRSATHLGLQVSLLLLLAATLVILVGALSLGGPTPEALSARVLAWLMWAGIGVAASALWPKDLVGLPLAPTILLFVAAAVLAGRHAHWRARWDAAGPGAHTVALLVATAGLSLLLYPTLVHFAEKAQRRRIEGEYANQVRSQSAWRAARLREVRREIDALEVLEESGGRAAPGLEELAFSIWSDTGLSGAGIPSAVEVQDRTGALISRFAWDLPALLAARARSALPRDEAWSLTRERLQVGSAGRNVLYARRRLSGHGEVHGAVHVFLGDDAWDLPFLPRRDPYTTLFRSAPTPPDREDALSLTVFARPDGVAFTTAERPPALSPELRERLRLSPAGLWTTLPVDGRLHHTYLVPLGDVVYAMSYPRLAAGAFLAGLVEAGAGLGALAALVALGVMLARTVAGRRRLTIPSLLEVVRSRFALRLFVSFAAAAVVPVAALELAFRSYVADRLRRESEEQALERASVAQRAVDDHAFYQLDEGPDRAAVTNSLLVWVARLIKGDVDVFGQGRLVASSKRELFSSGLLPATAPGPVFRALTLEGASSVLRAERIGGFSALVAYVPVRLGGMEPDILALPLAVKEREARATLEEFDRSMRLASLAFLALAAGLALSLSRRISEPIRDLTRATKRVAEGDLDARVSTPRRDELRDLVDSFNHMAGDLDRQRRELERSNRLAAWADMARQVAHEVKNPLTPIQLSAEHLQRVWRDQAPDFETTLQACTDTILRQVRTLRGMVTEFSAFARPPAPEPEPVNVEALVREALRPYTTSLPPGVSLDLQVEPGLPSLRLDRRLVTRAIVNLVENGLHAVGEAGRIRVRAERSAASDSVEIRVEDDGPGLGADALARAFEPFFSTKASGSGLGLALVKRVAEDHGGSASLESLPGGPTRAVLRFPSPAEEPEGLAVGSDVSRAR